MRQAGNSRLSVANGAIMAESTFKTDTLSVRFRPAALSCSGDLGEVEITDSSCTMRLTYAQARSLASQIMQRCSA